MKLPRWLVISIMTTSALSGLAAAGWWWVTWPKRAAREFVNLMDSGEIEHVRHRFGLDEQFFDQIGQEAGFDWARAEIAFGSRSHIDILLGRQEFSVSRTNPPSLTGLDLDAMWFEVERGRITRGGSSWTDYR